MFVNYLLMVIIENFIVKGFKLVFEEDVDIVVGYVFFISMKEDGIMLNLGLGIGSYGCFGGILLGSIFSIFVGE